MLNYRCAVFNISAPRYSLRRSWRSFDYSAFENDLISSTLINDTPLDINELFSAYDDTLRSLLDKHAPFRRVRHSVRPSPVWYDGECRATRRLTRKLERVYRRSLTVESCAAWKTQFNDQRQLFHRKATTYCSNDPKALRAKL